MEIVWFLGMAAIVIGAFWLEAHSKAEAARRDAAQRKPDDLIDAADRAEAAHQDHLARSWEDIDTPEHRPPGKWVNWKVGSGWIKVKGTTAYEEHVHRFISALEDFDDTLDTLRIDLCRDPHNAHDPNAIEVWATFTGTTQGDFMLGFVDAAAAAWLADTYDSAMPIAATIVRMRTNYENTSITICGLMPGKKEREQHRLV